MTTYLPETDLGTPRGSGSGTASVTIDGHAVEVPSGTSVMRAAAEAGVAIPKLCATDCLKAFGSCRMCLVEVEGRRGTPASCTTPCTDGMVVHTDTDKVQGLRRNVMELYLSDHPADCQGCARGSCEIQSMAHRSAARRCATACPPPPGSTRSTTPTPTSTTTRPPASSARAVSGPVARSRAPSR